MTATDRYAALQANDASFAHIALPVGATSTSLWTAPCDAELDGLHYRDLWWAPDFVASETTVSLNGTQYSDGTHTCKIFVSFENDAMGELETAKDARELAANLLRAADDFDGQVQR